MFLGLAAPMLFMGWWQVAAALGLACVISSTAWLTWRAELALLRQALTSRAALRGGAEDAL